MDCTLTQDRLIGYHFATIDDDERAKVEAHLVECKACLRTYLSLKAHVDRGATSRDSPSPAARDRLRAAVETRFRPTPTRRVRAWLTTPIPLYQGVAVVVAAVAAVTLAPTLARAIATAPVATAAERVDTARPSAESLTIY
jgi:anti-sigma factor RsiW